jgi:hypothetical protein
MRGFHVFVAVLVATVLGVIVFATGHMDDHKATVSCTVTKAVR